MRLARSHAELHRLPILVISADPAARRRRAGEARRLGNVTLLAKPFGIDQLLDEVDALLARRRLWLPSHPRPPAWPATSRGTAPGSSP